MTMSSVRIIDFSRASRTKLNPLSLGVRQFILKELKAAQQDTSVRSLVLTGGVANFSAGADITEFSSFNKNDVSLLDVIQALDDSKKPIVAAMTGQCLGGGLELALACHYRVALSTARLGLPEVHVGVIPGAGGTQRLPRVLGVQQATEWIVTGKTVAPAKAGRLVDAIVNDPQELLTKATEWAFWAETMPVVRVRDLPLSDHPAQAHGILHVTDLTLPTIGYDGPRNAIKAIRAAVTSKTFEEGMKKEAGLFMETLMSQQGAARRHAFFATRAVQKLVQAPPTDSKLLQQPSSTHVAVIGAGTMGRGIALVLLLQGDFQVHLVDINAKVLEQGMQYCRSVIEKRVKTRKMKPQQAQHFLSRLTSTTELQDLHQCELVVEAVVESMKIKQSILDKLDKITPPSALLLSNTSTLDIDRMAYSLPPQRRSQFAGWHFFSPAHVMKLVEIVVGRETDVSVVATLQTLSKRLKKTAVVVGNCDGFCGNRLLKPYSAESTLILTEGCSHDIAAVDKVLTDFGMALGPFQMGDLAGNDVGYNIRKERKWARVQETDSIPVNRPDRYTELPDVMVSKYNRLGQKSSGGWYDYDPAIGKGRTPLSSSLMNELVHQFRSPSPLRFSNEEVLERCLYPLVNEGFLCLEEGIVRSPADIDVVYLYGYGWPVWMGGPMHWADHVVTLPVLLKRLSFWSEKYPNTPHFQPSALLRRCVELGTTVEDYFKRERAQSTGQLSRL